LLKNSEAYDHYKDVRDKFPKEIEHYFIPKSASNVEKKVQPAHGGNRSYNRIIDESVIT